MSVQKIVAKIQLDHLQMMNTLSNLDKEEIAIADIIGYLSFHFGDEEYCMELLGYSKTELHKQDHTLLRATLESILLSNNSLDYKGLTEMKTLILNHISLHDAPLMEYLTTGNSYGL